MMLVHGSTPSILYVIYHSTLLLVVMHYECVSPHTLRDVCDVYSATGSLITTHQSSNREYESKLTLQLEQQLHTILRRQRTHNTTLTLRQLHGDVKTAGYNISLSSLYRYIHELSY